MTTQSRYVTTGEPRRRIEPRIWEHTYPMLNGRAGYLWGDTAPTELIDWAPPVLRALIASGIANLPQTSKNDLLRLTASELHTVRMRSNRSAA